MGDGSSGIYNYKSGKKDFWHLNNLDFSLIEKLQRFCKEIWDDIDSKYMILEKVVINIEYSLTRKN